MKCLSADFQAWSSRGGPRSASVARLGAAAALVALASFPAQAQQAGKVYRIGYLSSGTVQHIQFREAFAEGLRALGWIEGKNIHIEYRYAEGRFERLPELAAELVRLKVDVIAAGQTTSAAAAKQATATIPIVVMNVGDPVASGLVASLARPGGNVTGVSYLFSADLVGKHLELLRQAVPGIRRVAILLNPANPAHVAAIGSTEAMAGTLGVQPLFVEARAADRIDPVFETMTRERAEALVVLADALFILERERLAALTRKHRLPSIYGARENAEIGGLMSYGPSLVANLRRGASFVDKILRGAQPADLPMEQPATYELVVNLKTARALGLTLPQSLVRRADQVIE